MTTTGTDPVKRHLMSWGTGRGDLVDTTPAAATPGTATIVVEDGSHGPALLDSDVVGDGTLVLVPGVATDVEAPDGALVVGYHGSVSEPGADLSVNDEFFLQFQDYATSEYMSVIGATLTRITGDEDLESYLADADRARTDGEFATFVTDPVVQLGDLAALGAPWRGDGPRVRLYLDEDAHFSLAPGGAHLGALGDPLAALVARWEQTNTDSAAPCAVALGRTVDDALRVGGLRERPWLGRYLAALDAMRELHARGVAEARVSGFGGRLRPEMDAVDLPCDLSDTTLPLLLWAGDTAFVRGGGRTFQIDVRSAPIVEAMLVAGPDGAAELGDAAAVLASFADAGVPLLAAEPVGV